MTTLIEVAQSFAVEMGLDFISSVEVDEPESVKIVQFINETGQELVRRVDWHYLSRKYNTSTSGGDVMYALPTDFDRLTVGAGIKVSGKVLRGSLSPSEWFSLDMVQGAPRYFFLRQEGVNFYPYPAANLGLEISYQSKNWGDTALSVSQPFLQSDGDTTFLQKDLLVRGAMWRWNRHVGREYNDQLAEFEAMLMDYSNAEGGSRLP